MESIFQAEPKAFVDRLDGSSDGDRMKEIEESRIFFSPEQLGK